MNTKFTTDQKIVSRVWPKKQTQATLKELRAAGYTVTKLDGGYEAHSKHKLVLKAMNGTRGYLVRYDAALYS